MDIKSIIEPSLYFLALINPVSKIFLLSSMEPPISNKKELLKLSFNASLAALIILYTLTFTGTLLFSTVFHIDIYSLQIAGGMVLLFVGFMAVRKGVFYEKNELRLSSDFSIVPLGAPLIAGPATIAGAISLASEGIVITLVALGIALFINFICMLSSYWIGSHLRKWHADGALIRITGLIVAAISVQMILNGLGTWLSKIIK